MNTTALLSYKLWPYLFLIIGSTNINLRRMLFSVCTLFIPSSWSSSSGIPVIYYFFCAISKKWNESRKKAKRKYARKKYFFRMLDDFSSMAWHARRNSVSMIIITNYYPEKRQQLFCKEILTYVWCGDVFLYSVFPTPPNRSY